MPNMPALLADFSQQIATVEQERRRSLESLAEDNEALYNLRNQRITEAINKLAGLAANLEDALRLAQDVIDDLTRFHNTTLPMEAKSIDALKNTARQI